MRLMRTVLWLIRGRGIGRVLYQKVVILGMDDSKKMSIYGVGAGGPDMIPLDWKLCVLCREMYIM